MHSIRSGYRGLSLLLDLNWDRIISLLALIAALVAAAYIASQMGQLPVVERI